MQPIPDDLKRSPDETLTWAQRLLDEDRPFHAHEVLEAAWKNAPETEQLLWRGLAQVAVGLTHAQRGNATGAVALLRRGAENIEAYREDPPYAVDIAGVISGSTALADTIESAGLPDVRPRLRLRAT